MRFVAAILCLYLFGLCIQPAIFSLPVKKEKAMSCCAKKKTANHKGCGNADGNCCGDTPCNPFFSQCPICSGIAITTDKLSFLLRPLVFSIHKQFFERDEFLISGYLADLLRPPQVATTLAA